MEQIKPILPLKDLPRQRVTGDTKTVVGWHDGVDPYVCEALSDETQALWTQGGLTAGWCEFGGKLDRAARLVVRDARGRTVGWNVAVVPWVEVPRPEWISPDAPAISSAERTAWAIWIWQKAGPQWRLQSLGMLNSAARDEWLASYFLDSVLGEVPPVAPQ